jgi:uncharacterized protein YciI
VFVALSTYTTSVEEVLPLAAAHGEWVTEGYTSGRILVSGRRVPLNGGLLVVRGKDVAEVEQWVSGDPFVQEAVVEYRVYEFDATDFPHRSDAFESFLSATRA